MESAAKAPHLIAEGSEPALMAAAGYLAAGADRRFGTANAWVMMVYMDHEPKRRPMTIEYLYRLEQSIRRRWPTGERSPRASEFFEGKYRC